MAGCNTLTGGYTIEGSTLKVATLAQTLMACDADVQAQDVWVSELLEGGPTIALDDSVLSLSKGDLTLTLGDRASSADNALDGGSWALDSLDDAGTLLPAPERAFLAVTDGRLYVATGCNRGFGEVAVNDDGTVMVGVIALTKMACETPVNDWEQALSVFLSGTLSYEVNGTDVTLTNGTQTLTMHEVPWTP